MGHTEILVANKIDVLIIMKGGILMVFKMIEFVKKYGLKIIITLGLTFDFSVSFNFKVKLEINFKTLVFVYIGYQIVKQITKVVTTKLINK